MNIGDDMKKGFTLVELLTVIALIGLITLIAVPAVSSIMDKEKEKLYKVHIKEVKEALKTWGAMHPNLLPEVGQGVNITLSELKDDGLIDLEFTNPKTKNCYANSNVFTITNEDGVYFYNVTDITDGSSEDCTYEVNENYTEEDWENTLNVPRYFSVSILD